MKAVVIKQASGPNTLVHTEPAIDLRLVSRRKDYTWEIGPGTDHYGKPCTDVAILSCSSWHPDRKCYFASLRAEQWRDNTRSTMIQPGKKGPFDFIVRAPRYSVKDLLTFSTDALDELRRRADEPEVAAIFCPVKTVAEVVEKPDDQDTLRWLQSMVGGWIECVTLDPDRMEGYVHEEGKILSPPLYRNEVATKFWFHKLGGEFLVMPGDYVAGPLVIVGPIDEDGETTGVSDDVIAEVQAFVANPVETERLAKEASAFLADAV